MTLPDELIEMANEIGLGDLLSSPLSRAAAIRAINNVRASMLQHPLAARTKDEAEIEHLLVRICAAIPKDVENAAYQAGRAQHIAKQKHRTRPHAAL